MSFNLSQKVTYWTVSGVNENSEKSYNSPVTVSARYAEKDGVTTDEKGDTVKTMWIIYTKQEIPKRSLVVLGSNSDLTPPKAARMMIDSKSNSSFTPMIKSVL